MISYSTFKSDLNSENVYNEIVNILNQNRLTSDSNYKEGKEEVVSINPFIKYCESEEHQVK